jgi:hypothetical protein
MTEQREGFQPRSLAWLFTTMEPPHRLEAVA